MRHTYLSLCAATLLALAGTASAGEIDVMTQNQYLGADIAPLIGAIATGDQDAFSAALVTALRQIAANRSQERFSALANLVGKRQPHVVGLQEVWEFKCLPYFTDAELAQLGLPPRYPCSDPGIAGAFQDHLQATMDALGPRYRLIGYVRNFSVQSFPPFPGLPFSINRIPAFLKVQDRDAIIARSDVDASPVPPADLGCAITSEQGCNFDDAFPLGGLGRIERGFLAADVTVNEVHYRIFNAHLEVQGLIGPSGEVQALQAEQLIDVASGTPESKRLLILGDMNSSPNDPGFGLATPYMQFVEAGFSDVWDLRPGRTAGYSCCQLEDLSNRVSLLDQRIDLILTREPPRKVKDVRLLGEVAADRTKPPGRGLWPSDHASVAARIQY